MVFGAKFEVEWPTDPDRGRLIRSHFGARRKVFNGGLAQVKADLDARGADPSHGSVGWDLGSLRMAWNRDTGGMAPWWADTLKEAYSSGLADLARALDNWNASKTGTREGRRVGFPGFKSARRDPGRVRFTTGGDAAGTGSAHDRAAPHRGPTVHREHPPGAAGPGRRRGPDLDHDLVAAVGPVVGLDQLRTTPTRHPAQRC